MYKKSRCLCIGIFLWVRQAWRVSRKRNQRAYKRVVSDEGTPGTDGMTVDQLADYLKQYWPILKTRLLAGPASTTRKAARSRRCCRTSSSTNSTASGNGGATVSYVMPEHKISDTPRWCERTADVNLSHT